jgi:hypothetical protein
VGDRARREASPCARPGDPWFRLSRADRNELASLAVFQAAALIADKKTRRVIQKLAAKLVGREAQKLLGAKFGKMR